MPAGLRGLVIAGILATAMGSLSTALNALATSFARDFILPRLEEPGAVPDERRRVRVLRWSTVLFAVLIILVGVATAWYMAHNPGARIIPLVLGILGFTFGSLLGLFLVGLFTRTRGNDFGNVLADLRGHHRRALGKWRPRETLRHARGAAGLRARVSVAHHARHTGDFSRRALFSDTARAA